MRDSASLARSSSACPSATVGAGAGAGFLRTQPDGRRPRDCGTAEHERETASHGGDAIVSLATCLAAAVPFPGGRVR